VSDVPAGWAITGVCAAGKTTAARLLAARVGLALVEGDAVRPEGDGPSEERYRRLAAASRSAVVEDVVLGRWLGYFARLASPCRLVVLAPSADVVAARDAGRVKSGYRTWSLDELDRALRDETSRLGLWIDNSALTPEETVDAILDRADEARV
jgi:hypothetical protein